MSPRSNITVAFVGDVEEDDGGPPRCCRDRRGEFRLCRQHAEPSDAEKAELEARYLAYECGPQVPEGFSLAERGARFAAEDDGDDW